MRIRNFIYDRSEIYPGSFLGAAGMMSLYAFYVFSVIFVTYLGNISHFSSPPVRVLPIRKNKFLPLVLQLLMFEVYL